MVILYTRYSVSKAWIINIKYGFLNVGLYITLYLWFPSLSIVFEEKVKSLFLLHNVYLLLVLNIWTICVYTSTCLIPCSFDIINFVLFCLHPFIHILIKIRLWVAFLWYNKFYNWAFVHSTFRKFKFC